MKKIRFYYWMFQTLLKKHFLLILIAASIGALSFTQAHLFFKFIPKPKPTTYIGRVGLYNLSNLPLDIQQLVSQGLTSIDSTGTPVSSLASDWKVQDGGKSYFFTLNSAINWQDGTPFTSQDVNYSFQDVAIEKPDTSTVIFKLEEPFAPFPNVLSQPLFKRSSKTYLHTYTTNKIIGTGQYSITRLKRNGNFIQQLTLESLQNKLIYRFYTTETAAITAFKLGEIDVIEDLTDLHDLASWPRLSITKNLNKQRLAVVFFNTQDSDKNMTDKSIRQALTYAIPHKPTDDTRALGPISPNSWAFNPKVKPYLYSLETAQELLTNVNTNFQLELTTTPTFVHLAEQIRDSWQQLGFTVKIKVTNIPDTYNFQALLIGQQIPKDPDQYQLWHSTQDTNITGYQSAKIDKLLEDGRTETDPSKRKLIYQDFQRFLVEDSPAAFLHFLSSYTITR